MPSNRTGSVTSVARALAILETIATAAESLGVSEIARRCDLPKSTVVRLLHTLEELDVVERLTASGRYHVGVGLLRIAGGRLPPGQVRNVARPVLRALVDELGEDASLAVADGERTLFVDQILCENPVQVPDWSGQRMPYHATAAGYVLLADMDPAAVDRILSGPLERWTPRTLTEEREIRRRIADTERAGLSWVHEEWASGVNGIAAPVRDGSGRAVAVINVYGPSYRFPGDRPKPEVERLVLDAASRISAALRAEPATVA